jgi:small acid-soluble spore protein A (major alpha-type SASP)
MNNNKNKMVAPSSREAIEKMKYEIANELGVNMGPDASSRANGSVGGEITKRLVEMGERQMGGYQSK